MIKESFAMTMDIIRNPENFLKKIKDEPGIRKPFNFLTIFTFVVFIFLTYYYLDQMNMIFSQLSETFGFVEITIPKTLEVYLIAYFSFVVLYVVVAFIRYYIIHFSAFLLGAKEKYEQSYKALTYSLAPEYLSTPIFVVLVAMLPMMILHRTGLLVTIFVILLIPYLVVFFYTIYLRILALARLQDITMVKSFVAIYVLGFVGQIIVLVILEVLLIVVTVVVISLFQVLLLVR